MVRGAQYPLTGLREDEGKEGKGMRRSTGSKRGGGGEMTGWRIIEMDR